MFRMSNVDAAHRIITGALALLLVGGAIVLEFLTTYKSGQPIDLPTWHSLSIGATVGYYMARGASNGSSSNGGK